MPNDAIPQNEDVSANADAQQQAQQQAQQDDKPYVSPREQAMRDIARQRITQFNTESGLNVKSSFDEDADPDEAEAEAARKKLEDDAAAAAAKPGAQLAQQIEDEGKPLALDTKVKIKVDGVETEVTLDEMQRSFQKNAAADKRLEEASRRQRELDEREAQLRIQSDAAAAAAAEARSKEPLIPEPVAKEFTKALFDGDEEKAVAAFNSAVKAAVDKVATGRTESATPVDINQITATVSQQMKIESAVEKSREDYPAMYADPDIEQLAAMKLRAKTDAGASFAEALEATGREFAEKFGWTKAGRSDTKTVDTSTRDEKLNRKADLDPVVAASVKATTTVQAPPTNSQIIAEMAARRPGHNG